jgi:hypothetical protein
MSATPTLLSGAAEALRDKLSTRTARVGVVGLGYVGLPLAVELARAGFRTTGIDVDRRKVDAINRGESYILDVPTSDVARFRAAERLDATTDPAVVARLDTVNICVPTPLRKTKDPDLSHVVSAVEMVAVHACRVAGNHHHPVYAGSRPADLSRGLKAEASLAFRLSVTQATEVEHEECAEGRRRPDQRLFGARQALYSASIIAASSRSPRSLRHKLLENNAWAVTM